MRLLSLGFVLLCACTQAIPFSSPPAGSTTGSVHSTRSVAPLAIDSLGPWPAYCRHSRASDSPPAESRSEGQNHLAVGRAATTASGRLAVEVVQRPIRAHFACFRRCYEIGLARDPALRGRISVKLVIGASSGAVLTSEDAGSELPDREVVACVVAEFGAVRFAAPERGDVTVTYPIMFEPASESP